jgi:hypothetical protein
VVRVTLMSFPDAREETDMDKMRLEKKGLKMLLAKCWMMYDAAWFYRCIQERGIEKMNRVNRSPCRS